MRGFSVILMMITALLLAGCGDKHVSKEWNQKMTVTVEIDGETYVGSAVQRLQINYNAELGPYTKPKLVGAKRSHEAVIIDLGKHGYLFALWDSGFGYPERYVTSYPTEYRKGPPRLTDRQEKNLSTRLKAYKKYLEALARPENKVELKRFPEFITFRDMTNPKTIKSFRAKGDGYAPSYLDVKGFRELYGPTARVVSVVVENTQEPFQFERIIELFEPDFFANWETHAHGSKTVRGACWNSTYRKNNKLYCSKRKGSFVIKRNGVGVE